MNPEIQSEPMPFRLVGRRWVLGNRPARVASMLSVNDNGELVCEEIDARTGKVLERYVLGRAA